MTRLTFVEVDEEKNQSAINYHKKSCDILSTVAQVQHNRDHCIILSGRNNCVAILFDLHNRLFVIVRRIKLLYAYTQQTIFVLSGIIATSEHHVFGST